MKIGQKIKLNEEKTKSLGLIYDPKILKKLNRNHPTFEGIKTVAGNQYALVNTGYKRFGILTIPLDAVVEVIS